LQVDADDRIRWLGIGSAVVLAHADPKLPPRIDHAVGKAPAARACCRCGRQRFGRRAVLERRAVRALAIEPTVREVGEGDDAIRNRPGAAAVFVHACAHVERLWREIRAGAVGAFAHDHEAALLLRAALEPVQVAAIEPRFAEGDGLGDDQVGRDR
jgi:hypothetical protein